MDRRNFLKNSCFACMAAGAGISILSLESCSSAQILKTELNKGAILVDLNLVTDATQPFIVRVIKLEHDILVVQDESTYRAIYLQCSHENNPVTFTSRGLVCNAHGSKFELSGKVKNGPAEKGLKQFPTRIDNKLLSIDIDASEI